MRILGAIVGSILGFVISCLSRTVGFILVGLLIIILINYYRKERRKCE